jgi:hypothetical protein
MNNGPNDYWQPESTPEVEQPLSPAPLQPNPLIEQQQALNSELQTELPVEDTPITWTAQEYVHMERSGIWYVLFVLVVLALIAIDVFVLKSWTFSALVIVMAVAVVVYIRRPPRTLTYGLSGAQGLYIGETLYHLDDYKAFGLIRDGEHHSIMLIPRKRFAPGVSVFFPEEAGERIVDILGQRLPMEELKLDLIDIVVRKLRL